MMNCMIPFLKYESKNRRITVSCDAWPGVTPKESIVTMNEINKELLECIA